MTRSNRYPGPEDVRAHWNQFGCLKRTLVTSGKWAELWADGRGSAISVLPVLSAMSWGYDTPFIEEVKLCALTDTSAPTVAKGLRTLARHGLIEWTRTNERIHFVLTCDALGDTELARSFRFAAAWAYGRQWASLSSVERSVYIGLLASMGPDHAGFYESEYETPDEVLRLLKPVDRYLVQTEVIKEGFGGGYYLYRSIWMSISRLSKLIGIPRETVSRSILRTQWILDDPPYFMFSTSNGYLFHLPPRPYGVAKEIEANIRPSTSVRV